MKFVPVTACGMYAALKEASTNGCTIAELVTAMGVEDTTFNRDFLFEELECGASSGFVRKSVLGQNTFYYYVVVTMVQVRPDVGIDYYKNAGLTTPKDNERILMMYAGMGIRVCVHGAGAVVHHVRRDQLEVAYNAFRMRDKYNLVSPDDYARILETFVEGNMVVRVDLDRIVESFDDLRSLLPPPPSHIRK